MGAECETKMGDLAVRLKEETHVEHRQAERSAFVRVLWTGRLTRPDYAAFVADLYFIYSTLERELDRHCTHPSISPIHHPNQLARVSSLMTDCAYFHGSDWLATIQPSWAAAEYMEHVENIGEAAHHLLVAHSYVRYLGDLSGGQMMAKKVQKALGLEGDGGIEFFRFTNIADIPAFKDDFRAALSSLPLTSHEKHEVVAEAKKAFSLTAGVFNEHAGVDTAAPPPATAKSVKETLPSTKEVDESGMVEVIKSDEEEGVFVKEKDTNEGSVVGRLVQRVVNAINLQ